ncbi:MAG: VOC family protein [Gammaproteobacteria bacterium]
MSADSKTKLLPHQPPLSRRAVLGTMGLALVAPLLSRALQAQALDSLPAPSPGSTVSQLPLRTTGLEHIGVIVPDVTASATFYSRLFNPELHKEKEPPLRYYVTLGVGYLALGSRANESRAFFDHFCALVQDYDAAAMAEQLKGAGLPAGRYGIIPDPDAIGLQLLAVPGGLAKSTEPAGRIVAGEALVQPVGLDHVVVHVSDLEKSLPFYRKFFGQEAGSQRDAAWFQVAGTRLMLEKGQADAAPHIDRVGVKVQRFNRKSVRRELAKMGATVEPGRGSGLRFRDPIGLGIELVQAR